MKARVKWIDEAAWVAESPSGHALVLDGPPESGGRNLGVRPMEMVLMGLGGCTALDVIHILKKARQTVTDCVVELDADRAAEPPKVFTRIHVHYIVTGKGLQDAQVRRAITLSADKYCSVSAMLSKTAELTHDYEIRETQ
jgi:putative redox protein